MNKTEKTEKKRAVETAEERAYRKAVEVAIVVMDRGNNIMAKEKALRELRAIIASC